MKRLLVTGANGFVGTSLWAASQLLQQAQVELIAFPSASDVDLTDTAAVEAAVQRITKAHAIDWVLHLAAQSHVPTSFAQPELTFATNVGGTQNLLSALAKYHNAHHKADAALRVLFVSSGDVYGAVDAAELPITEARMPAPRSPYAHSKVAAEQLALGWRYAKSIHRDGNALDVMVARPFNHTGPGQREDFAVPRFAVQFAKMAKGLQEPVLRCGNLNVTRDFLEVEQVLAAYFAILSSGKSGEIYNIASGVELSMASVVDALKEISGVNARIEQEAGAMRPGEQLRVVASCAKLMRDTGFASQVDHQRMIRRVYESCFNAIA
jgi:GDP-4-dehydro-6-deoxy-D-mannose reductase